MLAVLLGESEVSAELAAGIYRETEGNPFFVEEIVKTLIDEGQIVCEIGGFCRRDSSELVLPQGVKAAIGRRLDHVSEATIEVLRTAAILGKTFDFAELAAVAEKGEDELLDAVDEAVAAQLLETGAGEAVAFTHDKIREVLYHELNPSAAGASTAGSRTASRPCARGEDGSRSRTLPTTHWRAAASIVVSPTPCRRPPTPPPSSPTPTPSGCTSERATAPRHWGAAKSCRRSTPPSAMSTR
ncbi:MAG: hypothetical protein P8Y93_12070 [Acidobacteriota bacterium]